MSARLIAGIAVGWLLASWAWSLIQSVAAVLAK